MKIAQFLQAGCNVKVLLADVHGFLDNLKAPIELVEYRAQYYRHCITALLRALNVPIEKLEFVLGSSYQMSPVSLPPPHSLPLGSMLMQRRNMSWTSTV